MHRIARDQIDQAIASIDQRHELENTVHDIRKRCKKLRGLIRLVRPAFPEYSSENAAFRDTAGLLAGLRDAKVLQLTYDDLAKRYGKHVDRRRMGKIRKRLTEDRSELIDQTDVSARLEECRARLLEGRERARGWELQETGWHAMAPGLMKTYGRAREAADQARDSDAPEDYHTLRKRIKYHWYHTRLLRRIWPDHMRARSRQAKEVSSILGAHHDLSVFEKAIAMQPVSAESEVDVEIAHVLARRQRVILQERAWPGIDRLLAQEPGALAEHWGTLWEERFG